MERARRSAGHRDYSLGADLISITPCLCKERGLWPTVALTTSSIEPCCGDPHSVQEIAGLPGGANSTPHTLTLHANQLSPSRVAATPILAR